MLFTLYTVILEVKKFTPCFTALIRASVSLDLQNNCFIFQEKLIVCLLHNNVHVRLFFNVYPGSSFSKNHISQLPWEFEQLPLYFQRIKIVNFDTILKFISKGNAPVIFENLIFSSQFYRNNTVLLHTCLEVVGEEHTSSLT